MTRIQASITTRTWQLAALGVVALGVAIYRHIVAPRPFDTIRVLSTVAAIALLARTLLWIRRAFLQKAFLLRHLARGAQWIDSEVRFTYRGTEWKLDAAQVLAVENISWPEGNTLPTLLAPSLADGFCILEQVSASTFTELQTQIDTTSSEKTLAPISLPHRPDLWVRAPFASLSLGLAVLIEWLTHPSTESWFPLIAAALCAIPFALFLQLAKPWRSHAQTLVELDPETFLCARENIAAPWTAKIEMETGTIVVTQTESKAIAWQSLLPLPIASALIFAYQRAAKQRTSAR